MILVHINDQFVLQEIADEYLIVPVGEASSRLHGVIRLNKTGAFLWKMMEGKNSSKKELMKALSDQFSIDETSAEKDIEAFLQQLDHYGCVE